MATTTLLTPSNHLILIPNSKFADSIVTNYSLPESASNITLTMNVAYDSDPRRVEEVLRDEARQLMATIPELVRGFEPVVRLQALAESSLQYQLVLRCAITTTFASGRAEPSLLSAPAARKIAIPLPSRRRHLHPCLGSASRRQRRRIGSHREHSSRIRTPASNARRRYYDRRARKIEVCIVAQADAYVVLPSRLREVEEPSPPRILRPSAIEDR